MIAQIQDWLHVGTNGVTRGESSAASYLRSPESGNLGTLASFEEDGRDAVIAKIFELMRDASVEGWDGYGAKPVTKAHLQAAIYFIVNLPAGTPPPDVSADPDGAISLEWYSSPSRQLSVSIATDLTLDYASAIGSARSFGSERLVDGLPKQFAQVLARAVL